MENQLDEIANGQAQWQAVMEMLWTPLAGQVTRAESAAESTPKIKIAKPEGKSHRQGKGGRKKPPAPTLDRNCPKCGKPLVERKSKHGTFIGCSGFPKCRHTERIQQEGGKE